MTTTIQAIHANIALIEDRLHRALTLVSEARSAASSNQQNLAIGTLLPAEQDISDAATLLKTVFVLHRALPAHKGER